MIVSWIGLFVIDGLFELDSCCIERWLSFLDMVWLWVVE